MSDTRGLEIYNQLHREKIDRKIGKLESSAKVKEGRLETLKEMRGNDPITYYDMDGPESITDLDDRKRLIEYFYKKLPYDVFRHYFVYCGVFFSFRSIPFLCRSYSIGYPPWFLEKYPSAVF